MKFSKITMSRKVYFPGFSLIEVSISLLIIGIISSIGISQLKIVNKIYASQKTQANIDFVTKAIGAYCIATDFKIPYPSQFKSNLGNQNESMKNSFGLIPFKSLGIMEKFAKNGNGKWLLYKMNPNFGKTTTSIEQRNIGVADFSTEIPGDKVAFIIKSQNFKNEDEITIWYSEKVFISNFTGNKQNFPVNPVKPKNTEKF